MNFDVSQRFLVVQDYDIADCGALIIMTNLGWWNTHLELVQDWCETALQGRPRFRGMTVEFDSEEDLALFCLCWLND